VSSPRLIPVSVAGFLLVVLCWGDEKAGGLAGQPGGIAAASEFRGSGSCSAVACHGSITRLAGSTVRRNEHTTWISDDPHSRAYQALFGKRSERIVRSLAPDAGRVKPAHEDERCLACHTTLRPASTLAATSWMNPDGVGCESCHGAARRWLGPHTTDGWRQKDRLAKEGLGLTDTKSLVRRAEICTGCHVGSRRGDGLPTRDADHDLIAAGHPRLNFELAAFLDNMPPHWDEKEENAGPVGPTRRARDFPARVWAIGQLATELASLELLHRRAADTEAPWPELTEYGCFSCHHDLRDEAWRRKPRSDGVALGTPRWGSWTLPLTEGLIERLVARPVAQPFTESLRRLSGVMAHPVPDRDAVKRETRETSDALGRCLEALAAKRFEAGEVRRLIDVLMKDAGAWDRATNWDEATRIYLALVALRQAWIELEPASTVDQEKLKASLEKLRRQLDFPGGFDSPRGFDPGRLRP
jgi:Cytochrome c554 and c-prime